MLTPQAKEYLKTLAFNPRAERIPCIIPLGGIHWRDEIPDFDAFLELPETEQNCILRLLSIRIEIWAGRELPEKDAAYWNEAKSLFPNCPIFQRLKLTAEEQQAQKDVEKDAEQFFDAMLSGATEIEITQTEGITKVSALHKLTDEDA